MIDSLITTLVAAALQAGTPGGLTQELRRDIEAAAQPAPAVQAPVPGSPALAVEPALEPPPPPPPPPPSPAVFGLSASPEKLTLQDDRWVRIGALPSRSPLLAALVAGAANMNRYQQASFVQATVQTKLIYRVDQDNWGIRDYWASADETIARGAGDCEDLALVKMQALRLLGFNERDLYLMTGARMSGEDHALLLVRVDGRFWVMEDGLSRLVRAEAFHTFRPAITYSAGWKWVHGAGQSPGQSAQATGVSGAPR